MKRGSVWVSFAVLWGGYSLMFTGYCWLRGYDVSLLQVVSPVNYYKGPWPPPKFAGTGVVPKGAASSSGGSTPLNPTPGNPWNSPLNPLKFGII